MEVIAETERLLLKVLTPDDVQAAQHFWGDDTVMEFAGGAAPHAVLPQVLASYQKCHLANALSVYGVIEKDSNELIGAAGFNIQESVARAELIYHFAQNSWEKGYATEAAGVCVELAKQHPQVRTIYASAAPGNESSIKVLEKIDFQFIEMRWFDDPQQKEPYLELILK